MARKKSTTNLAVEQEYNRELKRIQQFLRRASKRGYIWGDNVIPKRPKKITEKSVAKLKRLTPDVLYKKGEYLDTSTGELLSGTKGRALERKRATEKAQETRRHKRRKKDSKPKDKNNPEPQEQKQDKPKKPKEKPPKKYNTDTDDYIPPMSNTVLDTVRYYMEYWVPAPYWGVEFRHKKYHDKTVLEEMLDTYTTNYGESAVAERLEKEGSVRINEIVNQILYDSENETVSANLREFGEILKGAQLDDTEKAELEDWMESIENWGSPL